MNQRWKTRHGIAAGTQEEAAVRVAAAGGDPEHPPHQRSVPDPLRSAVSTLRLTPSQYNVLRILRGEGQPLPILEIASRTITVVPGITGLIDRLEEAGFVKRERCREDRRVIYVALTEKARKTLAALDEPLEELHERLIGHLTQAELKELIRLLEKAREASG